MLKIRCDKELRSSLDEFIKTLDFPAETTDGNIYDICILQSNDSGSVHNIHSNSIIIANGDNHDLVMSLGECRNTVITCGLSGICTVTLSSITDDGFVLCIQRNINDVYGRCILPQEIPVKAGSGEPYKVMFMYALALVCGEKPDKLILEGR